MTDQTVVESVYERHPEFHPANVGFDLVAAGFDDCIVDKTPNGRDILVSLEDGLYYVQPWNDNYLIKVDTIEKAHDAYHYPEKYR